MTLNLFGLEYPSSQTFAFIVTLKTKQRSLGCLSLITHACLVLLFDSILREKRSAMTKIPDSLKMLT